MCHLSIISSHSSLIGNTSATFPGTAKIFDVLCAACWSLKRRTTETNGQISQPGNSTTRAVAIGQSLIKSSPSHLWPPSLKQTHF
jgi:hypothetical protein